MSDETLYTLFMDMHSGGQAKVQNGKVDVEYIIVEGDEPEAIALFQRTFNRNPLNVTCSCCGEDYSLTTGALDQITAYHRHCDYDESVKQWVDIPRFEEYPVIVLDDFLAQDNVRVVRDEKAKQHADELAALRAENARLSAENEILKQLLSRSREWFNMGDYPSEKTAIAICNNLEKAIAACDSIVID